MCVCAWMCVHIHTQYIPESGGILQDQELWKKSLISVWLFTHCKLLYLSSESFEHIYNIITI